MADPSCVGETKLVRIDVVGTSEDSVEGSISVDHTDQLPWIIELSRESKSLCCIIDDGIVLQIGRDWIERVWYGSRDHRHVDHLVRSGLYSL